MVLQLFANLYSAERSSNGSSYRLPGIAFPALQPDVITQLDRPFDATEVWEALRLMGPFKAPGPDGFPAVFYQKNWSIVGEQVSNTVLQIVNDGQLPTHIGDALMVLIRKVNMPCSTAQFRPISLLNVVFKIATKMIVNRLKPILPSLVSPAQANFISGRQIIDNVVIVQEVLHTMASSHGSSRIMMLKIDLAKAYDRVRWDFLRAILQAAYFPSRLVDTIMKCQSEGSMELLWNGVRGGSFKPSRGVRQGDPLSPYLFVLCMEFVLHIIQNVVLEGRWKPIREGDVELSHLFFADDLILFAEATVSQAHVIKDCLNVFCSHSGEKVNFDKSSMIFSRSVASSTQDEISNALSIPVVDDFGTCLGVPTACGRMTTNRYSFLLDRITARLKSWQAKTLSAAGRVTMANSVLASLPVYVMQLTLIPRTICDKVDQQIRDFVWGSTNEGRKMHLLAWDIVAQPKKEGGLGLRSMRQTNSALLAKLGWRILQEPNSLWSRVIRGKYCGGRLDVDMFEHRPCSSYMWKGIMHGSQTLAKGLAMSVGNGHSTFFWEHCWLLDSPLATMSTQPVPESMLGATVAEYWNGTSWDWNILSSFLDPGILNRLASISLSQSLDDSDTFFWHGSTSGSFTTNSAMRFLCPQPPITNQIWNVVWKTPAQQRARHFLYLTAHNSVLCNAERLRRHLATTAKCPRCDESETMLHLLRDCSSIKNIWLALGEGIPNTDFFNHTELSPWILDNVKERNFWSTIFATMLWHTWKSRNKLIFEGVDVILRLSYTVMSVVEAYWTESTKVGALLQQQTSIAQLNMTTDCWRPPPTGWLAMNVDAATKGSTSEGGGGGLIRDERGRFVRAFTFKCGSCDALTAELHALKHGLLLAAQFQNSRFILIRTHSWHAIF